MIYWVFGGTAVGKKRFIQHCLSPATRPEFIRLANNVRAEWIQDGPVEADIVNLSSQADILVRWQWTREEHLSNILKDHPYIKHTVVVLTCGLIAQLSRVSLREGSLKWDAELLHGEQRAIYECVHAIAGRYAVPVLYVDASSADGYTLRLKVG